MLCNLSLSVAKEKKDPLALHLFHLAGFQLGKHIKALLPNTEPVNNIMTVITKHCFIMLAVVDRLCWFNPEVFTLLLLGLC